MTSEHAGATGDTAAARHVDVSIVVPVFNEEGNLPLLFERLAAVADGLDRPVEILFTDDGSKDGSLALLKAFQARRGDLVRVVEFDRNYGQHMAIIAAFERCRGDIVITLDADLQNPPEEIPKLLAAADSGHDVVGSYRTDRQDTILRRWPSALLNKVRSATTGIEMRDQGCMLRAYSRHIVKQIVASGEMTTYIPALAQFFAANPAEVEVAHSARHSGRSNYNLYRLARLNFDLMTGFSLVPLQIFTFIGIGVSTLSFLLVAVLAVRRIFIGPEAEGLFTLFAILFLLVGLIITGLGIIGEYVGRIYLEVRNRPRFHVRAVHEDNAD